MDHYSFMWQAVIAGLVASVACGCGAFPLAFKGLGVERRLGAAYAFAGGLMFAASFYNLLMPALSGNGEDSVSWQELLLTLGGMYFGCLTLSVVERYVTPERLESTVGRWLHSPRELLIFIAMAVHSIPEGLAVGVGYGAEGRSADYEGLGLSIALAIAIHNIPEGLAVAIPMRARGASIRACFLAAFLTSLPQPLAAIPASLAVWLFEPLMAPMLGFAAGAMMFLVVMEMLPEALKTRSPGQTAWSFMLGFGLMVLVQVAL